MKQSTILASAALLMAFSLAGVASLGRSSRMYTFQHENVLGTSFELKVVASSRREAEQAEAAALAEIDRQAKILSAYNKDSEFSRWARSSNEPRHVSAELFEVLGMFDTWRRRTGGALDASAETVGRVWKAAVAEQRLPRREELDAAVRAVRQRHFELDAMTGTARRLSNAALALNSFAKSYIVDRACKAAMSQAGIGAIVVNIGGDLVVRGRLTEPVDIADPYSDAENSAPLARLMVRDRAVATSGNYRRGYDINGRHYSHIVDPRSGMAVDHVISATVVAPDAPDAGALATAFSVLQPEESERLGATMPGVEFLLVKNGGGRVMSRGWRALEVPTALLPAAAQGAGLWDPSMELVMQVYLTRLEEERARRPYVAIWIEDAERFTVKTLGLWFNNPRWLPDLRVWLRADRMRGLAEGTDLASSVSSPTRPPGRYTIKWDGKDNHDKLIKAGKYTVIIEAAREHGTYQLIRQEMDFSGAAKRVELPGNIEIQSASLDYRKTEPR